MVGTGSWSLRRRLLVSLAGFLVVALGATITLQVVQQSRYAEREAKSKAKEMAHRYANQVGAELNDALLAARTLAVTFEGLKQSLVDDRSQYNEILSSFQKANPRFVATWSCWEPDALDGRDSAFGNKSGHDATGRFIPLWESAGEGAKLTHLVGYDKPGPGDYYLRTVALQRPFVTEPFEAHIGNRVEQVIGVSAPVSDNMTLVGAVGIFIPAAKLKKIVADVHPYEAGFARLVSDRGVYVAAEKQKLLGETDPGFRGVRKETGKVEAQTRLYPDSDTDTELLEVRVPIALRDTGAHWELQVHAPMERVLADANAVRNQSIVLGVLALLVMVVVILWQARSIAKPLSAAARELTVASSRVAASSTMLKESSDGLAKGAGSQASSLEETSASLEEMSSMTKTNAENAGQASDLANEAFDAAEQGKWAMEHMSKAISGIKTASDKTAKIIKTIDEIAFQTNLLALNAAVEAARAGDAGRGFAVVADEVRGLALRSSEAAKNTTDLLQDAQETAQKGVAISEEMSTILVRISESVDKVKKVIADVSSGSNEQSLGIEQVNRAVSEVDKVTQSNAANAEESAAASSELAAHARELSSVVEMLRSLVEGADSGALHTPSVSSRRPGPGAATVPETKRVPGGLSSSQDTEEGAKEPKPPPSKVFPLTDDELDE